MADSSAATGPILDPIAEGCWARRQLRNGIRYVPVASKLIKSLSSVQCVSGIQRVISYSMADISTANRRNLTPFAGAFRA